MRNKLKRAFLNRSGGMIVFTAGCLLGFCMVLSGVMEFHQANTIAKTTEDMIRQATVSMAINNKYNAYAGERDARSNAYGALGDGNWLDISDTTDLMRQLQKLYNFQTSGSKLVNTSESGINYTLDIQRIRCDNALSDGNKLSLIVTYHLEIPLRFLREIQVYVPIDNEVRASFMEIY